MKGAAIRVKLSAILILFIIPWMAAAGRGLDYYIKRGLESNPSLKELSNNILISGLNKSLIKAQYDMPHVNLTSNYLIAPYFNNGSNFITANPGPDAIGYDVGITNGGLYSAMLNVDKSIFNSGMTAPYVNRADIDIVRDSFSISLTRHSLEKEITGRYLKCYELQQLYYITQEIADKFKQQLEITGALVKSGSAKQSDYLLLKIEARSQALAAEQYRSDFISGFYSLNTICGITDSTINNLDKIQIFYKEPVKHSRFLVKFGLDSNAALNMQEIFETKYLPQLDVFFNMGLNAVELPGIQKKFGISAGINFNLPLYDGNQKSITRQQTQISLNSIGYYKENREIVFANKLADAKKQINLLLSNLNEIRGQLAEYEKVIKISEEELLHGQLSMIEYITIIKNYLKLRKNEASTSAKYQMAVNQYNYWNW